MLEKKIITVVLMLSLLLFTVIPQITNAQTGTPERIGLVFLEYHMYNAPPEVDYVGPELKDLYYELHLQLQNNEIDTTLHEVEINITDIVDMPIDSTTGELKPDCWLRPAPTSFGSNWIYWYVGNLQGSEEFWDWFHLFWGDRGRTHKESLGFSALRTYEPKYIPAEEDTIVQTVTIEIKPIERDKVLHAGFSYEQKLILSELLEYNHEGDIIVARSHEIEWRVEPPLQETYVFTAKFKLTRKPDVIGSINVIPWARADLRTVTHVSEVEANEVNAFLEDGIVKIATADMVDWDITYESPSKTVFFGSRETVTVGEILLSGLSHPFIWGIDVRGNIYFTEQYEKDEDTWMCTLKAFNPTTGKITELISHENANIVEVVITAHRDLYYILFIKDADIWIYEIHWFDEVKKVDETLYRLETAPGKADIADIDVDVYGNVYFSENKFEPTNHYLKAIPPSRLMTVTKNGTVKCLAKIDDGTFMIGIQVPRNPKEGVYFTCKRSDGVYILRYKDGDIETILKRPAEYEGHIAYTVMGTNGDLYYLYRQRAEFDSPDLWGYVEIGRFTKKDLRRGTGPTILLSEKFSGAIVSVWYYDRTFIGVHYPKNRVFATIVLWDDERTVNLIWVDGRTGKWRTLIKEDPFEFLPFVIDHNGDLYYAKSKTGQIIRIDT